MNLEGRSSGSPAISTLLILLGLAVLLTYVDRGAIGTAAPSMKDELALSATGFGAGVSAFFWIYVPACLAAGWFCDRFEVHRVLSFGVLLWSLATFLTGFVGSLAGLIALRLALGAGESIVFPAASKIIASEVPDELRGSANSFVAAGIAFGPAIGTLAGGMLMVNFGWRSMFLVFGVASLFWVLPWQALVPVRTRKSGSNAQSRPLGALAKEPALWLMGVGQFLTNYGFYFVIAWMPLYLVKTRGYTIAEMTALISLGFAIQGIVALFSGWLSDRLVASGLAEGPLRKGLLAIGQTGTAAAIAGVYLSDTVAQLASCLVLAGIASALLSTNVFALGQMFSGPRVAGSWIGVQNAIANTSGILGPIITGMIVDRMGGYGWAFAVAAGVALVGTAWWLVIVPDVRPIGESGAIGI